MTDLTTLTTKRCACCKETKPTTEFYSHRRHRDGLQSSCKPCNLAQVKKWKAENRDRSLASERRSSGRRRFWESIDRHALVHVRTEDELRAALTRPEPFYAEAR